MELKERLTALARTLPPAQRAGIAVALVVLVMAAVPFARWITTPSYAVLYGGLEDAELAAATTELDAQGVPYRLEGNRVSVPQDELHTARASLAETGITGAPTVEGYELLDDQALGVSDFQQRVDLQRAVEGELARTLQAMDAIETASVRLVMPEESLFTEEQETATASVLVQPTRTLDPGQVEAIALLVSSAVQGLATDDITVADTSGTVLHAPGDGAVGGVADRHQRRTREFEAALGEDLTAIVQRATDAPASVVVRADLDLDEVATETETFADEGTAVREQTSEERYEGTSPAPGGTVGVDGGPLGAAAGEGNYEKDDAVREYGVDRTRTTIMEAPGEVEGLSVALVVDEGASIGDGELQALVSAAAGIDEARGDRIAISRVAMPAADEAAIPADEGGLVELLQRIAALVVLLVIAVALFLMSRRRSRTDVSVERTIPARVQQAEKPEPSVSHEQLPATPSVKDEVAELVERQPEEIAVLLRGWLADRRTQV